MKPAFSVASLYTYSRRTVVILKVRSCSFIQKSTGSLFHTQFSDVVFSCLTCFNFLQVIFFVVNEIILPLTINECKRVN